MQRRIRQHQPELAVARRHRRGDAGPRRRGTSTIGRRELVSSRSAAGSTSHSALAAAMSGTISANGLSSRCLRPRSGGGRGASPASDGEVIAPETLDRENAPGADQRGGRRDRVTVRLPDRTVLSRWRRAGSGADRRRGSRPAEHGTAGRPGRGTRGAPGAQREFRHCCLRPVIGHVAHDGEPRAAIRAVDKRIPEAPVAGVGQLTQAVRAGRGICRHQRTALTARLTRCDHEFGRGR